MATTIYTITMAAGCPGQDKPGWLLLLWRATEVLPTAELYSADTALASREKEEEEVVFNFDFRRRGGNLLREKGEKSVLLLLRTSSDRGGGKLISRPVQLGVGLSLPLLRGFSSSWWW